MSPISPMIDVDLIKPGMPVVCSENGRFAVVDHLEGGEMIKLERDARGLHHYIPVDWVTSVDDRVHIDRPGRQAMQEWLTGAPAGPSSTPRDPAQDWQSQTENGSSR